jgi:crotonobetainyl-CoA:carnitine CoA-transferase CaiB-like acyl-CoA transferase
MEIQQPIGEVKDEITEILNKAFLSKTREEWFELSKERDICISPVYELNEIVKDPQIQAREMFIDFEDDRVGTIKFIGMPFKLSHTPGRIRFRAPGYGEHTDELLRDLNYTEENIMYLHKQGVISPKQIEKKGE